MPIRPLVMFPDPRLRQSARPVDAFGSGLRELAQDLGDTLLAARAIGLTAPHIGVQLRIVAVRPSAADPVRFYVNPAPLSASPETATHEEGSVSMPGIRETVERAARITLGWCDLDGTPREEELSGFAAAVLQHEIDQLDGTFWIDRLSRLRRDRAVKRYSKLQRLG